MAIHLDIRTQFDDRSVRGSASDLQRHLTRVGDDSGRGFSEGFTRHTPRVEKAMERLEDRTSALRVAQEKYNKAASSDDPLKRVVAYERLSKAQRDHASGLRDVAREQRRATEELQAGAQQAREASVNWDEMRTSLVQTGAVFRALGSVGAPVGIIAAGSTLVELAGIAASASQSLWLLPGALGAVGTAFGTLKLATAGLDDVFEDMGDPKKFAEALRSVSPAAQDFALSINHIMPALRNLQSATQDALFQGVGQQLNQLANTYLPTLQQATTGVADSFNEMFSGVTDQLLTGETQATVQVFLSNVNAAFQQLAPAAAPLTRALTDIMAVGSSFLPDIAQAATNAANAFAQFISEARASGDLQRWLSEGLDTLQQLGSIAWELGRAFMSLAPMGRDILPSIAMVLEDISTIMPVISAAAVALGPTFGLWASEIKRAGAAFDAIKGIAQSVGNAVIPILNKIGEAINAMLAPVRAAIDVANLVPGVSIPQIPDIGPLSPFGTQMPTQGGLPGAQAERRGRSATLPGLGLSPFPGMLLTPGQGLKAGDYLGFENQKGLPTPPEDLQQSLSDLQAPVLPIDYTDTSGLPSNVANAVTRLDEVNHDLAEKQARLQQLEASNVASAEDIQDARNDVAKAEQDRLQAQRALHDAQLSAYEKQTGQLGQVTGSMSEISAQLDQDLGVSNGLAGLADNLVRFLATLAAAPLLGPLSAISQARGDEGSGLMGILASNGAFGSQFLPTRGGYSDVGSAYGSVAISGGTPYAGVPLGSSMEVTGQPGLDLLRSLGLKGTTYSSHTTDGASTDREVDVTDPVGGYGSSKLTQFADFARQNPHLFEEFIYSDPTTGQKTGIRSGQLVGPGTSQPGYYADNWAGHQDHVHMEPAKGGGLGFGGSGVVPVNVVNGGSIAAPLTSAMGQWSADWNAIAQAESGGNWSINTGNGYSGGLQFSPSSWAAAGGTQYAPSAYQASPYQQALTAENLLAMQGPGAWPNTFVPGSSGPLPPLGSVPSSGGALGMGMGMPQSFSPGLNSQAYPAQGGEGGIGMGGMAMDGLMAATSGLDMMAPGAGAAAKIGIQLANRTAKYLGQVAGIGVSGLLETITPAGSSAKASIGNSWLGKIMGGLAGASPALPNMAGGKAPEMPGGDAKNGAQAAGNTINNTVNQTNNYPTNDVATGSAVREMGAMYAPSGTQ